MSLTRLIAIAFFGLVVIGSLATAALADGVRADTCGFTAKGRLIGCLDDAGDCSLIVSWRRGSRWFMTQEFAPKDPTPPPSVAAESIRPGRWGVMAWPSRRVIGAVVATNAARSRWKITDRAGVPVATARGPGGPQMGMLLLHFSRDVFC